MRNQKGVALLEFALVLPIFLLLVLGAMDLSFCQMAKSNLNYLTTQAASCAAKKTCTAQGYIDSSAAGLSLNPAAITVGTTITPGETTVTLSMTYKPIGPVFPKVNLSATAKAIQ
jgi:Flp pilus assembly protein TadG